MQFHVAVQITKLKTMWSGFLSRAEESLQLKGLSLTKRSNDNKGLCNFLVALNLIFPHIITKTQSIPGGDDGR
jgi:hypothetical protein